MCTFITLLLPEDTPVGHANPVFRRHGMGFPSGGSQSLDALTPGWRLFTKASRADFCDCSTGLKASPPVLTKPFDEERVRRKLQRIWRNPQVVEQHLEDARRWAREPVFQRSDEDRVPEIDGWCAMADELLGMADCFGVFLHSYRGGIENEKIGAYDQTHVTPVEFRDLAIRGLDEDVMYWIERG